MVCNRRACTSTSQLVCIQCIVRCAARGQLDGDEGQPSEEFHAYFVLGFPKWSPIQPAVAHQNGRHKMTPAMTPLNDTGTRMHADTSLFPVGMYKRLAFTIGTIGVLGFCNNLLVLTLYYKFKRLQTPTSLLLVNISVSDLLVSVFGTNFTLVSCLERGWVWDTTTCVWDGFSNSLFG